MYKQWVFRWHEKELVEGEKFKNVGIVLFFKRGKDFTGFSRWEALKDNLAVFSLINIKFSLFYNESNKSQSFRSSDFNETDWESKGINVLIFFDNHGAFRKIFIKKEEREKVWNFHQVIGHDPDLKMNNHSMFNLLQDVPPGFAGVMFVLSLIESAFTRVAVVDERVANWAFEKGGENNGKIEFIFKNAQDISKNILDANLFISASVWEREGDMRHQLVGKDKKNNFKIKSELEGHEEGISKSKFRFLIDNEVKSVEGLDILIIHLGFIEEIFNQYEQKREKIKAWLKDLHKRISKIVMISGRGYKPEEIPLGLPFREASLVTNYISSDFSKLNLVKGLISSRGNSNE